MHHRATMNTLEHTAAAAPTGCHRVRVAHGERCSVVEAEGPTDMAERHLSAARRAAPGWGIDPASLTIASVHDTGLVLEGRTA